MLYDVTRHARIAAFPPAVATGDRDGARRVGFAGPLLLLEATPCAVPCRTTRLADARSGRLFPAVGGDGELWVTSSADLGGDVWALGNGDATSVVIADVIKAGRTHLVDLQDGGDRRRRRCRCSRSIAACSPCSGSSVPAARS